MMNKIEILSPGAECRKTKSIIAAIKTLLDKQQVEYQLEIISNPESFANYNTWILPTVVINKQIVARGYKPDDQSILENLK